MPPPATKILGIGLACLDHLMVWDDAQLPVSRGRIIQYRSQGGGPTATGLVAASRLGVQAELWGAVGDDASGDAILHGLRQEHVNVDHMLRVPGQGPVFLVCIDRATGERYIHGTGRLTPPERPPLAAEDFAGAGCLLLDGSWRPTAVAAAGLAQRLGIPVVADLCHVDATSDELLAHVDYAIASAQCFPSLGTDDPPTACRMLAQRGAKITAVTLGKRGVLALADGQFLEQPAFSIDVVDTTGAGDTFHGAFCVALIHGLPLPNILAFAAAVAAMKCQALGGRTGIPTRPAVLEFLKSHGLNLEHLIK